MVAILLECPARRWTGIERSLRIRSPGHAFKRRGGGSIQAEMSAADFGRALVIEEGHRGRRASEKLWEGTSRKSRRVATTCAKPWGEVKDAVDAARRGPPSRTESKNILRELRKGGSGSRPVIRYSDDGSYVDLYDLCRRVAGSERLPRQARAAAEDVMEAVTRFMIASFGMRGYGQFEAGKNGVFIVLPAAKEHFRWYTPTPGVRRHHGKWSFLRDGATPGNGVVETWFELVESWFAEDSRAETEIRRVVVRLGLVILAGLIGLVAFLIFISGRLDHARVGPVKLWFRRSIGDVETACQSVLQRLRSP